MSKNLPDVFLYFSGRPGMRDAINNLAYAARMDSAAIAGDLFQAGFKSLSSQLLQTPDSTKVMRAFQITAESFPEAPLVPYQLQLDGVVRQQAFQLARDYKVPLADLSAGCISHALQDWNRPVF